ncbi:MAG: cytochrome C biogenesis protein [Thermoanaerobaculia bacterium]|nr:MAG: cytochrome C biogenesis protein [Thermoanaerobaculia bacterium]MBZ0101612.1 cytochrome c biogenesis protein CcsA [Thermoanaerobaculia bacterium]
MRKPLLLLLWLWMCGVIVAGYHWAPLAEGFKGDSSRILFFHVPVAWVSFVAFMAAGVSSIRFLAGRREARHDRSAAVAVELGLLFALLATLTGAIWARIEWGAWWNWDPRQTSIVVAMLFYAAYLALRSAIADQESRGRLSAAYATLGLVVAPFFYFILPRLAFTLHPEPVVNASAEVDVDPRMLTVLLASSAGFTVLYFWIHRLRGRLAGIELRRDEGTE